MSSPLVLSGVSDNKGFEIRTTIRVRKEFRDLIIKGKIPKFNTISPDQRKISNEELSKFIADVFNASSFEESHFFISNKDNSLVEIRESIFPSVYKHFFVVRRNGFADIIYIGNPKPVRSKRKPEYFKGKDKYKHVVHHSKLSKEKSMLKLAQDKPSDQKLINIHPMARTLFQNVVSKLGINIPREMGPLDQIYVGSGKGSNVVGFTTSDPNRIYVDINNFGAKVSGLNLNPKDTIGFFQGIQNKDNAAKEIITKINALKYIIEFASIPIHERGHNPVGSGEDVIYDEGKAQAVERNAETRMANMGLKFIKSLIDSSEGVDGVKPAFDEMCGRYQSSVPQYRTAFINKRDLVKLSRLSNKIKNVKYSSEVKNILNRYDKKIKNNKYRVYSEKGRNMGTYNSKSKAKNRLREIEYFKNKASDDMENSVDDVGVFFEDELPEKKIKVEDLFGDQSTGDIATLNRPNPNGVWYQKNASIEKRSTGLTSMVSYIDRPPDLQEPFIYSEEDDFLFQSEDAEEMPGNKPTINEKNEEDFMTTSRRLSIESFYKIAEDGFDDTVIKSVSDFMKREVVSDLNKGTSPSDIFGEDILAQGWTWDSNNSSFKDDYVSSKENGLFGLPGLNKEYDKNKSGYETKDKFLKRYLKESGVAQTVGTFISSYLKKNEAVVDEGVANTDTGFTGIPKLYGYNRSTKKWDNAKVEYFKKVQRKLLNLKDTMVAKTLNEGVKIEELQNEVTTSLGTNPEDGKYGGGVDRAVQLIYSKTSIPVADKRISKELLDALSKTPAKSEYSLGEIDSSERTIVSPIILEKLKADKSDNLVYIQDEYGSGISFRFGISSSESYDDTIVNLVNLIDESVSAAESFCTQNNISYIPLERGNTSLASAKIGALPYNKESINGVDNNSVATYEITEDAVVAGTSENSGDNQSEEVTTQTEQVTPGQTQQATNQQVVLPNNISSDPKKQDDNNEKIEEQQLSELVRIFDGMRSGRYDISVRSYNLYIGNLIKQAKGARRSFFDKLAYDKRFDEKSLNNYYHLVKEADMESSLSQTKQRLDRDQMASNFSDMMNKLHQILSSNGMISGPEGVATAVYRHYSKNKSKFGGDGSININNLVFFYKAGIDLLETLSGGTMGGEEVAKFDRDMRSKADQRYVEYGTQMAERFPLAKNNYQNISDFGKAIATMLRYFKNDFSSDNNGDKIKSLMNTPFFSTEAFFASINIKRDYSKFNAQKDNQKNYRKFAEKIRKALLKGFR